MQDILVSFVLCLLEDSSDSAYNSAYFIHYNQLLTIF